jgi:hypothetical protein
MSDAAMTKFFIIVSPSVAVWVRVVPVNSIAKLFVSCDINLNGAHQHMPTIARVIHPTIHHMRIAQ